MKNNFGKLSYFLEKNGIVDNNSYIRNGIKFFRNKDSIKLILRELLYKYNKTSKIYFLITYFIELANQLYDKFIENDDNKIDSLLQNLVTLYSKKIKITKLNYLNLWKYNILKTDFEINQNFINYNETFLRLYEDYKYKESYLETLKIIYQLKESENYSFYPNTNKIYNSQYNSKYLFDNNNYLTKYSPKNKYLSNYNSFDKKNVTELNINKYPLKSYNSNSYFSKYENNSLNKKKNGNQKIKLAKPINYFNISINHNKIFKRKNSFSNTIYLSNLQLSPYQSSKISLPNSKNKKTRNIRSKRNNLIYPDQIKRNKTEIIISKSKKKNKFISNKTISNTIETSNSFISDKIKKKPISKKKIKSKSIKIPNFNYLFKNNNDKNILSPKSPYYIYDNINLSDSNENSLTKKNSKDTKTAENSKLKSPDSISLSLSKNKKLKNYKSLNINLEDPLYEISSNDNNNYSSNSNNIKNNFSGISHNYINVKGIKKKETNSIISLQSISDEKLFSQAKLYLTKDNSLENFIRTNKTKKRNFKK